MTLTKTIGAPETLQWLSIPLKTLANWIRTANAGKLGEIGKQQPVVSDAELELACIKRELADVKMERDLLKKFAAYFAKESRGSTGSWRICDMCIPIPLLDECHACNDLLPEISTAMM